MPATVQTDPPGIWCMFSDGSTAQYDLGGLPCPGLAADLLAGLAELIHPHGSIDSAGTARQLLPGAEDADEGGIRDADVVTRKGPAAGVAAGLWW
jgi:hypothetical protein